MPRPHRLLAFVLSLAIAAPAAAADLVADAQLWGTYHGAAIYCRATNTDAFGKKAVAYIRRQASSNAEFEAARNAYGLAAIKHAQHHPPSSVGGNCASVHSGVAELLARFAQ